MPASASRPARVYADSSTADRPDTALASRRQGELLSRACLRSRSSAYVLRHLWQTLCRRPGVSLLGLGIVLSLLAPLGYSLAQHVGSEGDRGHARAADGILDSLHLGALWGSPSAPEPDLAARDYPERAILSALESIENNRLDKAEQTLDALLRKQPDYRLAHLLKGDLLMARAQPLTGLGNLAGNSRKIASLRQEALLRLSHHRNPPPVDRLPAQLLQLSPDQTHAVLVDASQARLYIYRNDQGIPRYQTDFYATIGKLGFDKTLEGDQRTPLGVYFITGHLAREQLLRDLGTQAELYGAGAWPINYPNEWDRQQARTGSGIWLHGVPFDTYNRVPLASNGCIALANDDLSALGGMVKRRLPVVIAPRIEWLDEAEWQTRRTEARDAVENWRRDWESLDTPRYLTHYSPRFRVGGSDYTAWAERKTAVNASKQWAKIRVDDLSLFAYPTNVSQLLLARFRQDYQSSNLSGQSDKHLYFERMPYTLASVGDATKIVHPQAMHAPWRVVYEGNPGAGNPGFTGTP